MKDLEERRASFQELHRSGCFVLPNPWDVGTARYLRRLGFSALATTSAGFSFSQGLPDADWAVPLDSALRHIAEIVAATDLPVNADFESGYAHEPPGIAENVLRCVATGVAGLSIEDRTDNPNLPLYPLPLAVERVKAARAAIAHSGANVVLTARAECFLVGHADPLEESIRRLVAFADAGADVLFAPGLRTAADIAAVVRAVSPKSVNVLAVAKMGLSLTELAALGVRRVSVGSGLARAAWTGFIHAATAIAEDGNFRSFDDAVPFAELNAFFLSDSAAVKS